MTRRIYWETHKEELRAKNKTYYELHKEEINARKREHRKNYVGSYSRYYNPMVGKLEREKIKSAVYAVYGNKCVCCGEIEQKFLCIDHINGGGSKHRRSIWGGGTNFYKWLQNNNYPPGFQVLCHNCNQTKNIYGECPHGHSGKDLRKSREENISEIDLEFIDQNSPLLFPLPTPIIKR